MRLGRARGRHVVEATVQQHVDPGTVRGTIEVTAEQVTLSNHSSIDTFADLFTSLPHPTSHITFNVGTFSATDSTVSAGAVEAGGTVTIQGLQGSGTSAHAVSLTNSSIDTSSFFVSVGGAISIRSENIMLNHASLHANAIDGSGGAISLLSSRNIKSHDSSFEAHTLQDSRSGGTIDLRAGQGIDLTNTSLDAHSSLGLRGGTITVAAPIISIRGSTLDVRGHGTFLGGGGGGTINLTGTKGVSLTESTLSAQSLQGNGGSIQVEAQKVQLTDTQLNTSVTGGPQTVGGTISIDAKNATLTNSQILSTATQGHGGTITINSNVLHRDPSTVIDASSQSGTDGTVTINGVIQP